MMIAEGDGLPICRVYDALDDDSHRVFRQAMSRSRGGVVRLGDLVGALVEFDPVAAAAALGLTEEETQELGRTPRTVPDRVPMANDPALRDLLRRAFALVRADCGGSITPGALLGAAVRGRPAPASPRPPAPPAPHPHPPAGPEEVEETLRGWLAAQALPAGERDEELRRLAALVAPGGYNDPPS
jgi:hypothetical protein